MKTSLWTTFAAAGMLACLQSIVAAPALPAINLGNLLNIANYGAVSSATITNTIAIQNAINAAAAGGTTNGVSGGTVEIPAGSYLSGPLTLKSRVNLQVDAGATLLMLPQSRWPKSTTPFIYGSGLSDVEISGAGTINGQGAGWWGSGSRPNFIQVDKSLRLWIQGVTLQNPPTFHLYLKNGDGDVTLQGLNIDTDPTSPNTDGMDLGSTNILVRDCHISDGDDNIEIGGSSYTAADIVITNCLFGRGHGVSVGSDTGAGVSNVVVINCTFTNTDNAIRLKSDAGRGGVVQNLAYYNLGLTNIKYAPILIYSYYNSYGNPSTAGVTPAMAAGTAVAAPTATTPVWRNIVISNLTATAAQPGMIWARTELPATNLILQRLNITATDSSTGDGSFAIYNASAVQVIDCQIHVAGSRKNFELFDAGVVFSNSVTGGAGLALDGASVTNALGFYNQAAAVGDGTFFGAAPVTLSGSVVTDTASLALSAAQPLMFVLGGAAATLATGGNLTLSNRLDIAAGPGFGPGTYSLLTYNGSLTGTPVLGAVPSGYNCQLDTGTPGRVDLMVTLPAPPAPAGLAAVGTNLAVLVQWQAVPGAGSYNLYRGPAPAGPYSSLASGLTATNFIDAAVTNGVTYDYVVTAVAGAVESTNSLPAAATVLPSRQPAPLQVAVVQGGLGLSWPPDHTGWRLEIQTNSLAAGLGTAWQSVPESSGTNHVVIPMDPAAPAVFLRLTYP